MEIGEVLEVGPSSLKCGVRGSNPIGPGLWWLTEVVHSSFCIVVWCDVSWVLYFVYNTVHFIFDCKFFSFNSVLYIVCLVFLVNSYSFLYQVHIPTVTENILLLPVLVLQRISGVYSYMLYKSTLWVKKNTSHYDIVHKFDKCWPIFKSFQWQIH